MSVGCLRLYCARYPHVLRDGSTQDEKRRRAFAWGWMGCSRGPGSLHRRPCPARLSVTCRLQGRVRRHLAHGVSSLLMKVMGHRYTVETRVPCFL